MSEPIDEATEMFAKILVFNCVRETFLEDIHSGQATLGQAEMKQLMRQITNKVYTFLKYQGDPEFMTAMAKRYPNEWDKAEIDEELLATKRLFGGDQP